MFAQLDLGLTEEEFYDLTPRLLVAMRARWIAQRRERLEMLAVLRADIINFSICHPKERVKAEDLLPPPTEINEPAPKLSREEVADQVRRTMALFKR